ncbi:MAG: bifunctional 3-deoxy-7-phosphoheptulonate synthase/chorismate mutase type II [Bacteroidales bacterium]|nr:bifunctional 3-deoxy-7-phosphoheptulonate synthase/chorismate mutase type II [Bacteroidales bacterium]
MKIIAGPCSIESRQQLAAVVEALAADPRVQMIRGGVWKPRTRPGGFEGLGEPALRWMAELKSKHTFKFCCEVALPEHVELCLQYGVDAVWLGARTTANPFQVQELCAALQGTAMPVMVKNAPVPDLGLWLGAIERCSQATTGDVSAVHRGFNLYNNLGYRNHPLWEVPLELRRYMPQTELICDPSHIAGRRDIVAQTAQMALDLGFDGLMVETHPNPDAALTDAAQQLTPDGFAAMTASLVPRRTGSQRANAALADCRSQIDDIDHQLLQLLARRMDTSRRIAAIKRPLGMALYQPERWQALMADRKALAAELGLEQDFVSRLLETIHAESVRVQQEG